MAVFKKQGAYWIDYGPDKRLAETVLRKRKVEIAEGRFLEGADRSQPRLTSWLMSTYTMPHTNSANVLGRVIVQASPS
jgi:hypothetical protein